MLSDENDELRRTIVKAIAGGDPAPKAKDLGRPEQKMIAVVPVKAESHRCPGKNLRHFGGRALWWHKVEQLLQVKEIDEVWVFHDCLSADERGRLDALHMKLIFRERPASLCDESIAWANDMLQYCAHQVRLAHEQDDAHILWAHCTNPMVKPDTFRNAITYYRAKMEHGHDSLVSVIEKQEHVWLNQERPVNDPREWPHMVVGQTVPYYIQNGAIFIRPAQSFVTGDGFVGRHPVLFRMSETESIDINTEEDFIAADFVRTLEQDEGAFDA